MILATVFALALNGPGLAKERPIKESFSAMDVFKIAYAANPVMSPNGQLVAFDRFYMDVMTDTRRNHLWPTRAVRIQLGEVLRARGGHLLRPKVHERGAP